MGPGPSPGRPPPTPHPLPRPWPRARGAASRRRNPRTFARVLKPHTGSSWGRGRTGVPESRRPEGCRGLAPPGGPAHARGLRPSERAGARFGDRGPSRALLPGERAWLPLRSTVGTGSEVSPSPSHARPGEGLNFGQDSLPSPRARWCLGSFRNLGNC